MDIDTDHKKFHASVPVKPTGPTHAKKLERVVPRSRLASHELYIPQGQPAVGALDSMFD